MPAKGQRKGNRIKRLGNRLMIYTAKDRVILASTSDESLIRKHTWFLASSGYAATNTDVMGKRTCVLMHQLIMQTPRGMHTDHANGNRADNRRENLRIVTVSENVLNTLPKPNKGIHKLKRGGKYWAKLGKKSLGRFDTFEEAKEARQRAEIEALAEIGGNRRKVC